ncbi:MAG: LacI family transcriptional regulator [Cyclobacteriaceae bacterium]|jgi:LacI family transcriptional regulator
MSSKKGPVTIKDIANDLSISPSTVSRALADNPLVKLETREAVKKLAKQLNYQPNFTALSLRSNKTRTIGIIIPQLVHEFFSLVIRGIEDCGYANGYNVLICSTHDNYEREVMNANALLTGRVDGLLACISRTTEKYDHLTQFEERDIPLVLFDCICDEINTYKVVIDDFTAGYTATKHLVDIGCKRIAYVGGPSNQQTNKNRFLGYQKALKEAGIELDDQLHIHCKSGDFEAGKETSKALIDRENIDGIFAGTDMLAIGAMKNIKGKGLQIPNDVAVVGFSNWSISEIYEPSLSTIDQPGYEMGYKAAKLLINKIKEGPRNDFSQDYETVMLKTDLIIRESSTKRS